MEKYYSLKEAGEILSRSSSTIRAYIKSGQLKARKLTPDAPNSKYIIAETDLEEFVKVGAKPGYYQELYPRPHKTDSK